jgi:hypothetical protein
MIGQMPVAQVIAMLNAIPPERAVDTLLAMPADRIEAVLATLAPVRIARLLVGARPDHTSRVIAVIGRHRIAGVVALLNLRQLAEVVIPLPLPLALELLAVVPPTTAADLLLEIPTPLRLSLREALSVSQPPEFASAVYQREAGELAVRVASRASWIDQAAGRLRIAVLDRPFEIVVRYLAHGSFGGDELREAAAAVDWQRVAAMVVVTNAPLGRDCGLAINDLRTSGQRVDIVEWVNGDDDGPFKRAVVKLVA